MMRLLNICVIAALVAAAAYVYKIKFESTRQAERVAKLRTEIRREHDAIAALRAEWAKLDNPARIQELAQRHLHDSSRPMRRSSTRSTILPERPADLVPPDAADPIGDRSTIPTCLKSRPAVVLDARKRNDGRVSSRSADLRSRCRVERTAAGTAVPKQSWRRARYARCSTAATSTAPPRRGARSALPFCLFSIGLSGDRRAARHCSRPRRTASSCAAASRQDAVATARPDILDRNGEILATDVRAPSLFAEPHRIIDVDEAAELLTAVMPDLDATEVRERLASQAPASSGSSARSRRSSAPRSTGSACRASASCRRTSASIRTAPRSRT